MSYRFRQEVSPTVDGSANETTDFICLVRIYSYSQRPAFEFAGAGGVLFWIVKKTWFYRDTKRKN